MWCVSQFAYLYHVLKMNLGYREMCGLLINSGIDFINVNE